MRFCKSKKKKRLCQIDSTQKVAMDCFLVTALSEEIRFTGSFKLIEDLKTYSENID